MNTERDMPSSRPVRHAFWKYPILALVLLVVIAGVAAIVGSPNAPRETIVDASTNDPGGAVLAFTQELDGTATSSGNASEYGMGDPAQVFVIRPVRSALPLLTGQISVPQLPTLQGSDVATALATYSAADGTQQQAWSSAYDQALGTLMPDTGGADGMAPAPSPTYPQIGGLTGDFGPVPTIVEADLFLSRSGYLQDYLQSVDPGHSFHLVNLWLYDHPALLNTALDQGLTDDQWGMVKERGFSVGPWYLIIPAVFHVYFTGGTTGTGFILWNLGFALILMFIVPLLPGLRDLPRRLKLYRFIYRYPRPGDLEQPAMRERHEPVHGGSSS